MADELQTGFGRTRSHYLGFETQNVIPDRDSRRQRWLQTESASVFLPPLSDGPTDRTKEEGRHIRCREEKEEELDKEKEKKKSLEGKKVRKMT